MYKWNDEEMEKPEPTGNDFMDAYNLGFYSCYLASKEEVKGIEHETSDANSKRWQAERERDKYKKLITTLMCHEKTAKRIKKTCENLEIELEITAVD